MKLKRKSKGANRRKDPSPYPKGWNRKRVQAIIDHYEDQSEDEAIAEAEAASRRSDITMMAVPVKLVPRVQQLIAKRAG